MSGRVFEIGRCADGASFFVICPHRLPWDL